MSIIHRVLLARITASLVVAAFILILGQPAKGQDTAENGIAVTVYSNADPASFDPQQFIAQQRQGYNPTSAWQVPGFGVIKEIRDVELGGESSVLRFTDVAAFIDPTTVSFADLTDPAGTHVLEQNFEFDLVGSDKLLEKYLDKTITVDLAIGNQARTISGKLLSATQGELVIDTGSGIELLNGRTGAIKLSELPGGLVTKPTLVWRLNVGEGGTHKVRTTYQTNGITWRADYNMILNEEETKADLGAWVTLMNLSGSGYKNAKLKLIAGDVQRIQPQQRQYPMPTARSMSAEVANLGFQEKSFFEYHLYTLPRRTDILMNSTQQITLFPTARDANVEKVLVYYGLPEAANWSFFGSPQQDRGFGNQSNPKVDVYVQFKNEKSNQLGMPLPKGKVRVYKRDDADGTLEFIGEDLIDHTSKDEKVLIKLGQAFDVVGERTQTDFDIDTSRREMTESFRIEIRNHKDKAQKVIIKENLYRWTGWEITQCNADYEKFDARTIHIPVVVEPNGVKTVTYTVKYRW